MHSLRLHRRIDFKKKKKIREYNGNHYNLDRAFNEISNLKLIGTIQKYLIEIDRLNIYAKIMDHYLIIIILNGITLRVRQAMAYYKTSALN